MSYNYNYDYDYDYYNDEYNHYYNERCEEASALHVQYKEREVQLRSLIIRTMSKHDELRTKLVVKMNKGTYIPWLIKNSGLDIQSWKNLTLRITDLVVGIYALRLAVRDIYSEFGTSDYSHDLILQDYHRVLEAIISGNPEGLNCEFIPSGSL